MLQTLEPRWTLQGAPVGRLFVSSKGDLAHIVGRVSQSMQQTPNTRGRWAADVSLFYGAHQRVNTACCHIGQPRPFTQRQMQVCHLWSALALHSASCLCTNYGINHTLTRERRGGEHMARPPHQACMQQQQQQWQHHCLVLHGSRSSAASRDDHNNAGTLLAVSQHDE